MFLAFNISDIVTVPFGYILNLLYQLTSNYGVALILFTIVVKLILLPVSAKSKKSMMQMSRVTPLVQAIQKKYENDPQRQNEAIRDLYKKEGVSMGGGCLWALVPLLIMLPLYAVVRQPMTYMLQESSDVIKEIIAVLKELTPEGTFGSGNSFYEQMVAAPLIPQYAQQLKEAIPGLSASTLEGVKFTFLGVNLAAVPSFNVFAWKAFNWATIGAFLIPVLSAASQLLTMFISQKMNNSVVTDQNGMQDEETAKKSQANQSNKMMMYMMPLMSLWIGFSMPAALSLYWLVQGIVSTIIDVILTKKYRVVYDAEDAQRIQRMLEQEAIEAEKERIRAERRAANPDGITENTSKKKLQQKQQKQQEAAKAAAAKEYNAKKGVETAETEEKTTLSGVKDRPYCKGRAYDPNRYKGTEE